MKSIPFSVRTVALMSGVFLSMGVSPCPGGPGSTPDAGVDATPPQACTYNSDCAFGMECSGSGGFCVDSECHEGNPFDLSVPARPCPAGQDCTFGDGVDLNHGNGWCEPAPCMPGAHQVQDCEFGQGGVFNYQTCSCVLPQPIAPPVEDGNSFE